MEINIVKEYKRFIYNYDFNRDLSLRTDKPPLARWAYGACEEWVRDFEELFKIWLEKDFTGPCIDEKGVKILMKRTKEDLPIIKQKLRTKFSDNRVLMEELK